MQMKKVAKKTVIKLNGTVREFILLTLIHVEERGDISKELIFKRIKELFKCRAIVIATENHQDEKGKHYHVGILNRDASKNTLTKRLRNQFPEWEGRAIDIRMHKGWGSICSYILKEDPEPEVWGEFTLDQIKEIANAHEKKTKKNLEAGNLLLLKKLEQIEDWYQVYRDHILANKVLNYLPRMKQVYEDLKVVKDIENNVFNRILDYLKDKGNPKEYDVEEIREKYLVIDWIACQLCFKRPIKTKQLFIYGEPSTQKTLLMNCLSKAIKIYFASSRRNDFTGANDHYDLWVFDEFHEQEKNEYESQMQAEEKKGTTTEGSAFVNTLLKVLDGQECRLDSKYERVFKKKKNAPIIMIANKLPKIMEHHGPFRARFYRVRFTNQIKNLEEERVIATLWGCLVRRAANSPYAKEKETPKEVTLNYNGSSAFIIKVPMQEKEQEKEGGHKDAGEEINQWEQDMKRLENPLTEKFKETIKRIMEEKSMIITKEGELFQLNPGIVKIKKGYNILLWEILKLEEEPWKRNESQINLIDFANIPIKKREEKKNQEDKSHLRRMFQQLEEKGNQEQKINEEENQKNEKHNEREGITERITERITRVCNIFLDTLERQWIRKMKSGDSIKVGHVQNEEVWSVISLQRQEIMQEQDYATWPLEIKIFDKEKKGIQKENGIKVFPAIIRNVRRGGEEEKEILKYYEMLKEIIENIKERKEVKAIKCEISISRNGERQTWNTEC